MGVEGRGEKEIRPNERTGKLGERTQVQEPEPEVKISGVTKEPPSLELEAVVDRERATSRSGPRVHTP